MPEFRNSFQITHKWAVLQKAFLTLGFVDTCCVDVIEDLVPMKDGKQFYLLVIGPEDQFNEDGLVSATRRDYYATLDEAMIEYAAEIKKWNAGGWSVRLQGEIT